MEPWSECKECGKWCGNAGECRKCGVWCRNAENRGGNVGYHGGNVGNNAGNAGKRSEIEELK